MLDILVFAPLPRVGGEGGRRRGQARHAGRQRHVARTGRIPIHKRAEAAVIAWMRHTTTAYDQMKIPQIKGKRRETRRLLAEKSRQLLEAYRAGRPVAEADCPSHRVLSENF